jgi:hypothetical protein
LKNFNNNQKYLSKPKFVIIYIVAAIFLISTFITLTALRNLTRKIDEYNNNLSAISGYITKFNEDFNKRTGKLSSAELLMNNTNLILSAVYFATSDTEELEEARDFTAFSIMYKDKYYVITAGHCVEMDGVKYKNFKFKANNKSYFISLKLIDYRSDYGNNIDYAIFYDPHFIRRGLYPATPGEDQTPQYVLGNIERDLNLVKRYKDAREGESGSPVLNSKCHVVGILIKKGGAYTPISEVLDALDRIDSDL